MHTNRQAAAQGRYGHGQRGMGAAARAGRANPNPATSPSATTRRARSEGRSRSLGRAAGAATTTTTRRVSSTERPRGRSTSQTRPSGVPAHTRTSVSPAARRGSSLAMPPPNTGITNIAKRQNVLTRALSPRKTVVPASGKHFAPRPEANFAPPSAFARARVEMPVQVGVPEQFGGGGVPDRAAERPLRADPGAEFATTNQAAMRVMQRVKRLMNVLEGGGTQEPTTAQPPPRPQSSGPSANSSFTSNQSRPAGTPPSSSYYVSKSTAEIMKKYSARVGGPGGRGRQEKEKSEKKSAVEVVKAYKPHYASLKQVAPEEKRPAETPEERERREISATEAAKEQLRIGRLGYAGYPAHQPAYLPSPASYASTRGFSPPPRNTTPASPKTSLLTSPSTTGTPRRERGGGGGGGEDVQKVTFNLSPSSSRRQTERVERRTGVVTTKAAVTTLTTMTTTAAATTTTTTTTQPAEEMLLKLSERLVLSSQQKVVAAEALQQQQQQQQIISKVEERFEQVEKKLEYSAIDETADADVSLLDLSTASRVGRVSAVEETVQSDHEDMDEVTPDELTPPQQSDCGASPVEVVPPPPPPPADVNTDVAPQETEKEDVETVDAKAGASAVGSDGPSPRVAWPVEPSPMRDDLMSLSSPYPLPVGSVSPENDDGSFRAPAVSPSVAMSAREDSAREDSARSVEPSSLPPSPPALSVEGDAEESNVEEPAVEVTDADAHEAADNEANGQRALTLSPVVVPARSPPSPGLGSPHKVVSPASLALPVSPLAAALSLSGVSPRNILASSSPPTISPPTSPLRLREEGTLEAAVLTPTPAATTPPQSSPATQSSPAPVTGKGNRHTDKRVFSPPPSPPKRGGGGSEHLLHTLLPSGEKEEDGSSDTPRAVTLTNEATPASPSSPASPENTTATTSSSPPTNTTTPPVKKDPITTQALLEAGWLRNAAKLYPTTGLTSDADLSTISTVISSKLVEPTSNDLRQMLGDTVAQAVCTAKRRLRDKERLAGFSLHRVPVKSLAAQMKAGLGVKKDSVTPLEAEVALVCGEWADAKIDNEIANEELAKAETNASARGWQLSTPAARRKVVDSWADVVLSYLLHDTVEHFNRMEDLQR